MTRSRNRGARKPARKPAATPASSTVAETIPHRGKLHDPDCLRCKGEGKVVNNAEASGEMNCPTCNW